MPHQILIVDDEEHLRNLVKRSLAAQGLKVEGAASGEEALALVRGEAPSLVLLDLRLPGLDGLSVLKQLREAEPGLPVIIITAYATVETAIEAMKLGARDYLTKPFDLEELKLVVWRALEEKNLARQVDYLRGEVERGWELLGESEAMSEVKELIERVAPSQATVLLTGESGTGKEVVARSIHRFSGRNGPLVAVNCAALPENLLESELFGHERGAFTGATARRVGRFELADGGTIFLDEVAEMPSSMQVKLLRVLQDKSFQRVGGTTTIKVDVRVIAASNVNLAVAIKEGRFREDLYYRLNVFTIHLPPLRARREDIPLLANHFLARFRPGQALRFSEEAMRQLCAYAWPGNVRELENAIERACLTCKGSEIGPEYLPLEVRGNPGEGGVPAYLPPEGVALEDVERELLRQALRRTGSNQTRAAALLRISRSALIYRMQKYGLS